MNISIFVFGNDKFLATLPEQIRDTNALSVEVFTNLTTVVSRIKIKPPDVIFVQASQEGSKKLCGWLKEQTKLSWVYTILIEDRPQQLADRNRYGWERELEMTTKALRQGADAYIWQVETLSATNPLSDLGLAQWTAYNHLVLAQLTVGLRKAQKYRDLMRTNDVLSAIALADSLTELNNRRALEWDLPRQIHQTRTHTQPLSLIILDVDFFKKVNDTYGHLVGDRLLQLLCTRIRHNLRFQDTPFRYGGEEFVILLADTNHTDALSVAQRLNRIVSDEPFAIDSTLAINVTISLGVASLQAQDDPKGISLLHRADQCLLQAKASGRNCVVSGQNHPSTNCKPQRLQAVS